ncbi:MAG: YigZ family protein [Xanthomonadales bacterium]|nr:YigZ family protein [Xanthomonadales bacterium]
MTLAAPHAHGIEVKKSRFLAQALPCVSPDEAQAQITAHADPDATHNCWAWRIGEGYRSSDDGEPAGTAGRPILAAIDGSGLDQVAVVVTRWYGGIKLGAGGLVRAYGGAAAECLRTAPRLELPDLATVTLRAEYDHTGAIYSLLSQFGAIDPISEHEAQGVVVHCQLPVNVLDDFSVTLRDATRGRAILQRTDEAP